MAGLEFIIVLILIAVFVAGLLAINLFIKVGKAKGYAMENSGLLWFIGIFAPLGWIAVGIYVAALPDNRASQAQFQGQVNPAAAPTLPSLDAGVPAAPVTPAPAQHAAPASPSNDLPAL